MEDDLGQTVAALARRVQRLEDELAIQRLIVGYGLAVDAGSAERGTAVFTDDATYDVDVGRMDGREAIGAMIAGPRHQAMVGHCAHQIGPATITLGAGERAVAVGYSRVYLETPAGTHVYRVSMNRWELVKQDGEWRIAKRTTRRLGHPEALDVIRPAAG